MALDAAGDFGYRPLLGAWRGHVGVKLHVEAESGRSTATTRAEYPVTRSVTIEGRLEGVYAPQQDNEALRAEFGVAQTVAPRSRLYLRLREASDAPGRAEFTLRLAF